MKMTIGEYMDKQINAWGLVHCVQEKSVEHAWVTFKKMNKSTDAEYFAKFIGECVPVSIRGNKDGSTTYWF